MNMRLSELFAGLQFFITIKYIRSYDVTRRGLNELVNDISKKQIKDLELENIDFDLQERSSFKFESPSTDNNKDYKPDIVYDDYRTKVLFEEESEGEDSYAIYSDEDES